MNKQLILSMGLGAVVVTGAILVQTTGAFFTSTATASANTFNAGTLDLKIAKNSGSNTPTGGWLNDQSASWNFSNMAPGGEPSVSSVWLKNMGTVDGMHLGISAANTETPGGYEKQVRITSLTLDGSNLLIGGAGATIATYVAPTNCTITVGGSGNPQTITNAIAAANTGDVICATGTDYTATWEGVGAGNPIVVNKSVTVQSMAGPSVTASIPFDVTASDVTIRGFSISNPAGAYGVLVNGVSGAKILDNEITNIGTTLAEGSAQGIYLAGGAGVTSFTAKNNTITNIGNVGLVQGSASGSSAKGIYIGDTAGTATLSGVEVSNNIISNVKASPAPWTTAPASGRGAYGILINYGNPLNTGSTNGAIIKNNSINNLDGLWSHAVGLEGRTPNAAVTLNDIRDLVDHKGNTDAVGVQLEANAGVASVVINQNNLTPNVVLGINNTTGTAVNGQNNWWGDMDPSDQVSANVNTAGFLGGSVAGFINGTDQNSNGFADLQDLRLTPLTNVAVSLNAGAQKQLVMGVQVDGPSTGNTFQGAGLTTQLTFTLSQQ